jgi:regulator of ribosome biosynthesis
LTLFSFFKFEPTEKSVEAEKNANLALIRKLGDSSSKKAKRGGSGEDGGGGGDGKNILNVRKAVRFASRGEGAVALARKSAPRADNGRQKRKGKQ